MSSFSPISTPTRNEREYFQHYGVKIDDFKAKKTAVFKEWRKMRGKTFHLLFHRLSLFPIKLATSQKKNVSRQNKKIKILLHHPNFLPSHYPKLPTSTFESFYRFLVSNVRQTKNFQPFFEKKNTLSAVVVSFGN